ncbi:MULTISPECIES: cation-translocating P-type ATPase [Nocardioides]|uniref:Cation-translocating P-type ATPase n=1 Tax=Nocardioides vastitatis TaxID=2568655 RepID=A0ABW0ZLG1_9ACTN|nr:cation-transporting P-type ATPase [Nocardioides sp.]THJ06227.1 cation-transporting P-type ATPase [Nocardioides sp.]
MTAVDTAPPTEMGLTSAEAQRRLERDGPNDVPRAKPRKLVWRVAAQLTDPMSGVLCLALVVVLALGDVADAIIIAAVVVVNTAIGVIQEVRAENAIAALGEMAAPRALVRRDGVVREAPARDLVVGDVVRLEAGDIVPADMELVEAVGVEVDEASMTGESEPVARAIDDELMSGTVLTRGRGFGVVVRTGAASGLGRIAQLIASTSVRATPLQQRLLRLSRQLVVLTAGLCLLVFLLTLARGGSFADSLILAVSLGVAAIPESLPAVVSVALALGAYRMARRSAIVRWLPAVETLGSVSVLASDKTGTLTEGRMAVRRLWTRQGACEVTGAAYDRGGALEGSGDARGRARQLLRDLVLCNDARLTEDGDSWSVIGDPMEGALLVAAAKYDEDLLTLPSQWCRVDEIPFDAERRSMTTVHEDGHGNRLTVVKGAPEVLIEMVEPGLAVLEAEAEASRLAEAGFRVLAVADTETGSREALDLVGLVGLVDPPRADAAAVVASCQDAGIRLILITGDHPATALAVATELGIARTGGGVTDGAAVGRGEHLADVESIDVYARIRPEQKVDIVDAWQARGHVVAMTGDGVNDAPALRRADIGVAMGDRGTEVARQAADLVLADDNLRTVVTAVGEGRRIYANVRTFLQYGLSGGLAEVLVILLAPFLGMPIVLLPAQILWINMITHGVPGVAFGGEPLDSRLMGRPSPSPERSVLGSGLVSRIVATGSLIAAASLGIGILADGQEWHVPSAVFATLGLAQLGVALALRAPRPGKERGERSLEVAVVIAAALQVLALTWSPLQGLLGTQMLTVQGWGAVVLAAALPGVVVALARRGLPVIIKKEAR